LGATNDTGTVSELSFARLRPGPSPEFAALLRIYHEAIPASERKDDSGLAQMLAQDDYEFRVAFSGGAVLGFTIVKTFSRCEASLLEYMAVDRARRGGGIGGRLFREACSAKTTRSRFVLIEVEDEDEVTGLPEDAQRRRRKAFYRANGCREVAGLSYLMPTVSADQPPRMNLLAFRNALPANVDKAELRRWLESIYVEVYRQPVDDARIAQMLSPLPSTIALR
jgi:GNAT superfamily N-acetyltransferase